MKKKLIIIICLLSICMLAGCSKKDSTIRYTAYYYKPIVDNYPDYLYCSPFIQFDNSGKVCFILYSKWFEDTIYDAQGIEHTYEYKEVFPDDINLYTDYDIDGDTLTIPDKDGNTISFTIVDEDTLRLDEDYGKFLKKGDEFIVHVYVDNPNGRPVY